MSNSIWNTQVHETSPAPGIRLQSQAFRLTLPFNTSFTWNRPLAVLTTTPQGDEQRLPVEDVTRLALISLALGVLGVIILVRLLRRN